jgi:hypothetical protein
MPFELSIPSSKGDLVPRLILLSQMNYGHARTLLTIYYEVYSYPSNFAGRW